MSKKTAQQPSRERILDAAIARFMQTGYAGTSLAVIASDVGVSTPALYWHFRSKDEIYYSALKELLGRFVTYVSSATRSDEPVERLSEIVRAHVTWQLEQADLASVFASSVGMRDLVGQLPAEQQAELKALERTYLETVRRTLAAGRDSGDFDFGDLGVTSFAIITMCEFVHSWYNPAGSLRIDAVAASLVTAALRIAGTDAARIEQIGREPVNS